MFALGIGMSFFFFWAVERQISMVLIDNKNMCLYIGIVTQRDPAVALALTLT